MSVLDDYKVLTTKLQAVNLILEACGLRPVGTLDSSGVDADTAMKRLGEANIEIQEEGWSWNQDDEYPIDPGADGTVTLPANTLKIRQIYSSDTYQKRLVQRGSQIYDRKNHTFKIAATVKVDITFLLDFEQIPQAARWYIALVGARRMASSRNISGTIYQFTKADEDMARLRMEQAEDVATSMDNMMATNPHIQFMRQK
jgi:hypothetical protein